MGLGLCNWRKSGGDVTLFCFQPPRAAGSQPARISPKTPPFSTSFYCLSMKVKVLDYCDYCKRWSWKSRSWSIFFPLSHWTTLYCLLMNAKGGTVPWVVCHQGECPVHRKAGSHSSSPPSRPLSLLILRSSDEKEREKWKIWSLILVKWLTTDLPKIKVHCTLNIWIRTWSLKQTRELFFCDPHWALLLVTWWRNKRRVGEVD